MSQFIFMDNHLTVVAVVVVQMSMSVPFRIMAVLLGVKTPRDPITAHALQGLFCFLTGNDAMVSHSKSLLHPFIFSNVPKLAMSLSYTEELCLKNQQPYA